MEGRGGGSVAAQLQRIILHSKSLDSFLTGLAAHTSNQFAPDQPDIGVLCGITLTGEDLAMTSGSSPQAVELEELRSTLNDEPWTTDTTGTAHIVVVNDTGTDSQWPAYCEALRNRGIGSVLRTQLIIGADTRVEISVYATVPRIFTPEVISGFQAYTAEAATSVELALKLAAYRHTAADLHAAMESRTNIDIAVGIVIAQNHCTQAEAVQVLRRASSQQHLKLRALAEQIVQSINTAPAATHFVPAPGQNNT